MAPTTTQHGESGEKIPISTSNTTKEAGVNEIRSTSSTHIISAQKSRSECGEIVVHYEHLVPDSSLNNTGIPVLTF